jgi:hypothetical protein
MRIVLQVAHRALAGRAPALELASAPRWMASRRGFETLPVRRVRRADRVAVIRAATNLVGAHYVADRRAGYEFRTLAKARELADRLVAHELASASSIPRASFLEIETIFVHRVRVGVSLCKPEGFAALEALFDFERFAAFLTQEAMRHLDSAPDMTARARG